MQSMNEKGTFPDYEVLQSLEYMDMIFYETLRLHTTVGNLQRATLEEFHIPGKVSWLSKVMDCVVLQNFCRANINTVVLSKDTTTNICSDCHKRIVSKI